VNALMPASVTVWSSLKKSSSLSVSKREGCRSRPLPLLLLNWSATASRMRPPIYESPPWCLPKNQWFWKNLKAC
jgi:hypothetical protein